jgi:hypothetical protein
LTNTAKNQKKYIILACLIILNQNIATGFISLIIELLHLRIYAKNNLNLKSINHENIERNTGGGAGTTGRHVGRGW